MLLGVSCMHIAKCFTFNKSLLGIDVIWCEGGSEGSTGFSSGTDGFITSSNGGSSAIDGFITSAGGSGEASGGATGGTSGESGFGNGSGSDSR